MLIRPGTDGALACAMMHCLFRDGMRTGDYLEKYTDAPRELEAHVRTRTPEWAAAITGCPVETIEAFAALVGERKRTYFRLGYGFARSRNGAVNMHAASCIAAVTRRLAAMRAAARSTTTARSITGTRRMIEGLDVRRSVGPHARPVAHRPDPDRRRATR